MSNITVSALEARRNFGELLNRILYRREEIFIERKGRALAKIVPIEKAANKKSILSYAGIWKTPDVGAVKRAIKKDRLNASRLVKPL